MELAILLAVVIAVPVVLLVWTRRGSGAGSPGSDPQGHRDLGRGGVPGHSRDDTWGSGGAL